MKTLFLLLLIIPFLLVVSKPAYKDLNDILSAAGNHKEGRPPKLVFINHFNILPMSHYPVKKTGPSKETPPHQKFLLPDYMFYLLNLFYITLSVIICFHLLRRRSIDHSVGTSIIEFEEEDDFRLLEMTETTKRSEGTRLFLYRKWTNHVATAEKLRKTFERDFIPEITEENDEMYAKNRKIKMEQLRLHPSVANDEF